MKSVLFVFVIAALAFAGDKSLQFARSGITVPMELPPSPIEPVNSTKAEADIDIATIIAIGKAVWEFVKANAPVVNYKTDWAGAVPKGVDWMDLEGFKDAKWGPFGWTFENLYGMTTVEFKWNFAWTCKGRYNGHGAFIMNAGAAVEKIYAAWGFTVNANVDVDQTPTNYGTKVDPIAGLNIEVTLDVKTVIQSQTARCRVNIRGDCSGKVVACN